jgi:N-acetylglucosaminyldiphosphoundecaprenol N-acetyl-beta-D-mannosaminyltransferase
MLGNDRRRTRISARESILGHPVHPVSRPVAARAVVERALEGSPGSYVCLTNVHTTVESQRVEGLRRAVEGAFLSVPDGKPLVWILRRRGHRSAQQIRGADLMPLVAAAGKEAGLRHFFYGGSPGVAEAAGRSLTRLVPETQVVGASSAPFAPIDRWPLEDLQAQLRETRPHILWLGLGAPKQEMWMSRVAGDLEVPVMIGVGAALDFLAGGKRAAPRFLIGIGLEWLFRLATEPRRLWRRYLIGNTLFLYLLAREALGSPARVSRRTNI